MSGMDLLIQVSFTESFNMVTADGICAGVPSVVSPAIHWAPDSWKADSDDAMEVAEVGIKLLLNNNERKLGMKYLKRHTKKGLKFWLKYLNVKSDYCWNKISRKLKNLWK